MDHFAEIVTLGPRQLPGLQRAFFFLHALPFARQQFLHFFVFLASTTSARPDPAATPPNRPHIQISERRSVDECGRERNDVRTSWGYIERGRDSTTHAVPSTSATRMFHLV